jgi:D-glycero-beta-D-manno-heptose-7-phosphate kinase
MQLITEERFQELTEKFPELPAIVVVGDVGIDKYTLGNVRRISPEAPVPIIEVKQEWEKLGLAANIGHNLSTLNVNCTVCGVLGQDERANLFERLLEEHGLKTWGLIRDPIRPTIFKERITTEIQQICRIDYEDLNPISINIEKKMIQRVRDFIDDHGAIILEDYAKGTLTEELIRSSIELGKESGKIVAVDPGVNKSPLLYKGATLLKPNHKEAILMVESLGKYTKGKTTLQDMGEILLGELDIEKLVITLGGEGMALWDKNGTGKMRRIPTVAQEVFDVSGAGDTTISLLVAGLLGGASLEEAAWLGNCGAGVVVAKKGTATVTLEELTIFYKKLEERYAWDS